jgi:predicted permease
MKFLANGEYQRDRVRQYFEGLISRLEGRPEVQSAAATMELPLSGGGYRIWQGFEVLENPSTGTEKTIAVSNSVTPHFFETMHMSVYRGRGLTEQDTSTSPRVVVVSDMFARTFLPGHDAVGKQIRFESDKHLWEIVGVVNDVKPDTLDGRANPVVYRPFAQHPAPFMAIVVRTRVDPAALAPSINAELQSIDADVPPYRLRTGEDLVGRTLGTRRFGTALMVAFAAIALVLALVGLYAVISNLIVQSTREIGLRVALGASRAQVLRSVLREALGPSAVGLLLGSVTAAVAAPAMQSLLFGVEPLDPAVMLLVPLVLAFACVLACLIPARRALRVDPIIALRAD